MNYSKGIRGKDKNSIIETIKDIPHNTGTHLLSYVNEAQKPIKIVFPLMRYGVNGLSRIDVLNLYKEF